MGTYLTLQSPVKNASEILEKVISSQPAKLPQMACLQTIAQLECI